MKKISTLLLASLFVIATGCDDDDDDDDNQQTGIAASEIENTLTDGSFSISRYINDGEDETSDFDGYSFVFSEGGTAVAFGPADTTSGTWNIEEDDNDETELHLYFGDVEPLVEIDEDWDVLNLTESVIELDDDDDDQLSFTRE